MYLTLFYKICNVFLVNFSELQRLYQRFQHLDRNKNGTISADELNSIPELCMNPLSQRIIAILSQEGSIHYERLSDLSPRLSPVENNIYEWPETNISQSKKLQSIDYFQNKTHNSSSSLPSQTNLTKDHKSLSYPISELSFPQFVKSLTVFSKTTSRQAKLDCKIF